MNRIAAFVALLACLSCERSATPGTQTAASSTASMTESSTPVATPQISDALEEAVLPEFQIVAPDSSEGDWYLDTGDLPAVSPEFFVGSHVRHPSGVMVIWFDTAVRATEDHGVGRARADSVVVEGLQHLEYLARFCGEPDGAAATRVVGLVTGEADTTARPRLAWRFNPRTFRIERYPVESIRCMIKEPVDEVD